VALFNYVKRLVLEDFPNKYQDLMDPLIVILNNFMYQTYAALNGGLTFKDNFLCVDATFNITGGSNGVQVKNTGKFVANGCIVLQVTNNTSPTLLF